MKARDIMTRKVLTAQLTTPVADIARILIDKGVSAVPIVDRKHRVLGIVTEGDLLRRVEAGTQRRRSWWSELAAGPQVLAREYVKSRGTKARDVMTRPVVSVADSTDVGEIADLMEKWNIKRVPVMHNDKLVGIVSRRDLLRVFSKAKQPRKAATQTDARLRSRLKSEIAASPWIGDDYVNFVVDKGRIQLYGLVPSTEQRDAIRIMAERLAGAKAVKDELKVKPTAAYAY